MNNPYVPLGPITPIFTREEFELIARALNGYISYHEEKSAKDIDIKDRMALVLKRVQAQL